MPTKLYVYVAGPISKGDMIENVSRGIEYGEALLRLGYIPFVPHTSVMWQFLHPHTHQQWLDYDFYWVAKCDALLRIPGESKGADMEVKCARQRGIPVFYDIEELEEWRKYGYKNEEVEA